MELELYVPYVFYADNAHYHGTVGTGRFPVAPECLHFKYASASMVARELATMVAMAIARSIAIPGSARSVAYYYCCHIAAIVVTRTERVM